MSQAPGKTSGQKKPDNRRPKKSLPAPRQRRPDPGKRPPYAGGPRPSVSTAMPAPVATPTAIASIPAPQPPPAPPPRPAPPPPRKPHRRPHRPKLTQEALQGETPLRTFSELMAFFEAKREEDKPQAAAPESKS